MRIYQLLFIFVIVALLVIAGTVVRQVIPSGGISNRRNIQEIASMYRNDNIDCVNAASRLLYGLRGEGFNATILVGNVPSMKSHVWVIVTEIPGRCGVAIEPNSGTIVPLASFVGIPCYSGVIYDTADGIDTYNCEVV